MAVQDVPAVYTVTRRNHWRYWGQPSAPLVSDTVQLDAKGNFSIPVVLTPDADADLTRGERFSYQVEVSVTGDAGETQTAQYSLSATGQAYFFYVRYQQGIMPGRFHIGKTGSDECFQ